MPDLLDWDAAQNLIADAQEEVGELEVQLSQSIVTFHEAWSMLAAAEVHLQNAQNAVAAARQRFTDAQDRT